MQWWTVGRSREDGAVARAADFADFLISPGDVAEFAGGPVGQHRRSSKVLLVERWFWHQLCSSTNGNKWPRALASATTVSTFHQRVEL